MLDELRSSQTERREARRLVERTFSDHGEGASDHLRGLLDAPEGTPTRRRVYRLALKLIEER